MLTISQVASRFGLSRSTLLYYDTIGLLSPSLRSRANYRLYSPADVERKETALHHVLMGAPDAIEGGLAYVERRKPDWKLRVSKDWPDWPE